MGIWNLLTKVPLFTFDISGYNLYAYMSECVQDNAAGDVTGTANANIFLPAHIHKWFTWKVCNPAASPTPGYTSSGFGSYSQAVTDLDNLTEGSWELFYRILEPETPDTMRARIARQAPIDFYVSMLDGAWRAVVYPASGTSPGSHLKFLHPDGSTVYKWDYNTDMLEGTFEWGYTPLDECVNEVHIRYGMYAPTGQYTKDCWVGPNGSDNGTGTDDQNTTAPNTRSALAVDSRDDLHIKHTIYVDCPDMILFGPALALRNYYFDRFRRPRLWVRFVASPRAATLEPGMVTYLHNNLQDVVPCPWYPAGASAKEWDDINFFVRSVDVQSSINSHSYVVELEEIA
jgi:hypothetical protein